MAKKQQKNAELYAAAEMRLQDFLLVSVNECGEGLPADIRDAITTINNCKRLTYRYVLSMDGKRTPIIDTRLLKDAAAPDWLKSIHIKVIKGADLSKTKVPPFMRRITVSEAAALQGFPKDFEFCGSQCDKYKQIGNSVPPPFAYAIASRLIFTWEGERDSMKKVLEIHCENERTRQ